MDLHTFKPPLPPRQPNAPPIPPKPKFFSKQHHPPPVPVRRLTESQKQFWLEHGFLKIPACFSRSAARNFAASIWPRLDASPNDNTTWPNGKINMPSHNLSVSAKTFAPQAWSVICEILGGEDRIADWCHNWKDAYIPNFGEPGFKPDGELNFRKLTNWHTDGDSFVHFLDSPEQGLLVIPLFTDILPKGGGTVICTDTVGLVAKRLFQSPSGTFPSLLPRHPAPNTNPQGGWSWVQDPTLTRDESFFEVTGQAGDVYILHPFMLHSASKNLRRDIRIITNPPVALKEPFKYFREDSKYSLCEKKTLRELGRPEGLPEWKIACPREKIVPARLKVQQVMREEETQRLKAFG